MAGIEKVCEYSGRQEGGVMYAYKRNSIQVLPEYRKLFRGKSFDLFLFQPVWIWEGNWFTTEYNAIEMTWPCYSFRNEAEYIKWYAKQYRVRLTLRYEYLLYVPDVPGQVNGLYFNSTYELGTMYRKIKRLMRARKLNPIRLDCFAGDFDLTSLQCKKTVDNQTN